MLEIMENLGSIERGGRMRRNEANRITWMTPEVLGALKV